jgi:hypothetical protein
MAAPMLSEGVIRRVIGTSAVQEGVAAQARKCTEPTQVANFRLAGLTYTYYGQTCCDVETLILDGKPYDVITNCQSNILWTIRNF